MELREIKSLIIEHIREKYSNQIPTIFKSKDKTYRIPFKFKKKSFEFLINGTMVGIGGTNIMPTTWLDVHKPYCLDELDSIIKGALNVKDGKQLQVSP